MADREKLMKGLECCSKGCGYRDCPCGKEDDNNCMDRLIADVLALLKEQEPSEWVEDSDPGQKYGTTWACFKCGKGIHEPFIWNPYDSNLRYCPFCGRRMKWGCLTGRR